MQQVQQKQQQQQQLMFHWRAWSWMKEKLFSCWAAAVRKPNRRGAGPKIFEGDQASHRDIRAFKYNNGFHKYTHTSTTSNIVNKCSNAKVWNIADIKEVAKYYKASNDPDIEQLVKFYLDPKHFHMASGVSQRKNLGLSSGALNKKLMRLGCSLSAHSKIQVLSLLQKLASHCTPDQLPYALEQVSYDESSMLCNVKDTPQLVLELLANDPVLANAEELSAIVNALQGQSRHDAVVAKILQTRAAYGFLIKTLQNENIIVVGEHLSHLQMMGRANSETLVESMLKAIIVHPLINQFQVKCRATTTDKAKYNKKGEFLLQERRGDGWSHFNLHCTVHCIATCLSKTMSLVSDHVQGLLRVGLSLKVGTYMSLLRKAIQLVVAARLQLCVGQLTADAKAYKEHVLQVYHQTGTNKDHRIIVLLTVLNGDWRNESCIEYYTNTTSSLSQKQAACSAVSAALIQAYASCKPPIYPRHRWTGADAAIDWVASFQSCHGLFHHVYK
eukprot:5680770-Amphidinium_carterae.1